MNFVVIRRGGPTTSSCSNRVFNVFQHIPALHAFLVPTKNRPKPPADSSLASVATGIPHSGRSVKVNIKPNHLRRDDGAFCRVHLVCKG